MLAVDRADFREMRLQKAACEHSGSDELIDAGSGEDSVALDLREHLNHVTRRDDVAKAKTRGEDLREGAEADRAVRRQIPDGDRRLLFVPEFAIRIVFNDPEIVLLGFFNQRSSSVRSDCSKWRAYRQTGHRALLPRFQPEPRLQHQTAFQRTSAERG